MQKQTTPLVFLIPTLFLLHEILLDFILSMMSPIGQKVLKQFLYNFTSGLISTLNPALPFLLLQILISLPSICQKVKKSKSIKHILLKDAGDYADVFKVSSPLTQNKWNILFPVAPVLKVVFSAISERWQVKSKVNNLQSWFKDRKTDLLILGWSGFCLTVTLYFCYMFFVAVFTY